MQNANKTLKLTMMMVEGEPCILTMHSGRQFDGHIWEVYRALTKDDVRVRLVDTFGRVHHFDIGDIMEVD